MNNNLKSNAIHPNKELLCKAIESDLEYLEKTIQLLVKRAIQELQTDLGISFNYPVKTLAQEIFNQTIETVLSKADEFNPELPARPWFLKFATYVIKGWKRDQKREHRRVVNITDLPQAKKKLDLGELSEEEILGRLNELHESPNPDSPMMVEYLLSFVKDSDREVLQLAFIDGLDGQTLAAALGISLGAAYTKKHRALERLRKAYIQSNPEQ